MAKGDHIYISFWFNGCPITHHGIDCGDGSVIHYDGQKVCRISKTKFTKGKTITVKEYGKCDADDVVVQRAENRLNERKYNPVFNNCEHFAYYCKVGRHKSEQVNRAGAAVGGAVAGGVVGTGTQVATKAATRAAMNAVNPMSKALINLGLKQAPTVAGRAAAGIAGAAGLVSCVATDLVVGKMLEDDGSLPEQEREARKNAKRAGQVASMAGGVAGTIAAATVGGASAIAIGVAAPAVLGIGIGLGSYHLLKGNQ